MLLLNGLMHFRLARNKGATYVTLLWIASQKWIVADINEYHSLSLSRVVVYDNVALSVSSLVFPYFTPKLPLTPFTLPEILPSTLKFEVCL